MKGSTWHRWDLHYHTPSSYDHHNKSKTNQEIVINRERRYNFKL